MVGIIIIALILGIIIISIILICIGQLFMEHCLMRNACGVTSQLWGLSLSTLSHLLNNKQHSYHE